MPLCFHLSSFIPFLQEHTSGIQKLVKQSLIVFIHFIVPKMKFSKLINRVEWGWGKFQKYISFWGPLTGTEE